MAYRYQFGKLFPSAAPVIREVLFLVYQDGRGNEKVSHKYNPLTQTFVQVNVTPITITSSATELHFNLREVPVLSVVDGELLVRNLSELDFTNREAIVFYRKKTSRRERLAAVDSQSTLAAPSIDLVESLVATGRFALTTGGTTYATIGLDGVKSLAFDEPLARLYGDAETQLMFDTEVEWVV
jgi:hypothetical protein